MIFPLFIKTLLASWFFTQNEVIQDSLHTGFKAVFNLKFPSSVQHVMLIFYNVLSCPFCLGFFTTLAFTFNIWEAILVSLILKVITK